MHKSIIAFVITLCIAIVVSGTIPPATAGEASDPMQKTKELLDVAVKAQKWSTAISHASKLGEYYDKAKKYDQAVKYYDLTAQYYGNAGKPDWTVAYTIKADQIRTVINAYVAVPAKVEEKLAKFEPISGTYLGFYPAGKKDGSDPRNVSDIYGKKHAIYLTYTHWRKTYGEEKFAFPMPFAEKAKQAGGAIQVAWEPSNGMDDVLDDVYVHQFAKEAKQIGIPVFLRFAGEMNGDWTKWSGDPQKYIEKFRMIHDIMAKEAPNVAMVWSPNFLPRHNLDKFYPGDDYVDWVGLSLYTIPYSKAQKGVVLGGNPIDYLRPIYDQYSHKPIMISEGAVSFVSYIMGKRYEDWAVDRLTHMYSHLTAMFPKVKAITYFNLDKLTTNYDNQDNNYDLTDSQPMWDAYRNIIASPQFLSDVLSEPQEAEEAPPQYVPIKQWKGKDKELQMQLYAQLPNGQTFAAIELTQDTRVLGRATEAPWIITVKNAYINWYAPLFVTVKDENDNVIAQQRVR